MLSKLVREDEDFPPRKKEYLALAMQLNERYSWRYGKEKFMSAISFFIIIFKTQGHPTTISSKCIKNTFKAVQSTLHL